mmetsp:Transcript_5380/g.9565  ORF Transcript_5380/g.9565 Transcript_5380/m.9565 type:complete len:200 (-) Transcript_5380:26-625(-)
MQRFSRSRLLFRILASIFWGIFLFVVFVNIRVKLTQRLFVVKVLISSSTNVPHKVFEKLCLGYHTWYKIGLPSRHSWATFRQFQRCQLILLPRKINLECCILGMRVYITLRSLGNTDKLLLEHMAFFLWGRLQRLAHYNIATKVKNSQKTFKTPIFILHRSNLRRIFMQLATIPLSLTTRLIKHHQTPSTPHAKRWVQT